MKIGFVTLNNDIKSASGRLRAFNLIEQLNKAGLHKAELYTPSSIYDALVFIKACRTEDLVLLKKFQGLTVLDLCDNLLENSKYVTTDTVRICREMAHHATCVAVASEELGVYTSKYNDNIFYIPDLTDIPRRNMRIMWFGLASNWRTMQQYMNIFNWLSKEYDFEIHAIADWSRSSERPTSSNFNLELIKWSQDLVTNGLNRYDLFFSPKMNEEPQWERCKSSNKVMLALKQGLDVVASSIPEYEKIATLFPNKVQCFHDLMELNYYLEERIKQFNAIQDYQSQEDVVARWNALLAVRGIQKPMVTVITAAYNASATIGATIDSVLAQTYDKFEYIIVDDASTDNTSEVLSDYASKDARIKIITNKKNLKQGRSRNKAIKVASGSLIANIDADDLMQKERLVKQVDFFNKNPLVDIIYCGYTSFRTGMPMGIYSRPREYDEEKFLNEMNLINNSTTMWRKGLFYDTRWNFAEDYSTWIKAIKVGLVIQPLDINATYFRLSDTSNSFRDGNFVRMEKEKNDIINDWKYYDIDKPKVSIIMPTYNRRLIIPKSIESVLAQSFQDWELIIINDGGEDISKIIPKDKRIKYLTKVNGGLSSALNYGIQFARANYIALLDDDDL